MTVFTETLTVTASALDKDDKSHKNNADALQHEKNLTQLQTWYEAQKKESLERLDQQPLFSEYFFEFPDQGYTYSPKLMDIFRSNALPEKEKEQQITLRRKKHREEQKKENASLA